MGKKRPRVDHRHEVGRAIARGLWFKNTTLTGSDQDRYLDALWKVLSRERLEGGYGGAVMPRPDAITRYLWNIALCEALYPSLHALEAALRNTVFAAGDAAYPFTGPPGAGQTPCWLDMPGVLLGDEPSKVAAAKRRLKEAGKPLEPGRVVAELTFGFWTALFDVRYESTKILWPRLFGQKIFADAPRSRRSRKALSPLLNRIRLLRNRAFHHEPIWHWSDLPAQHALTLDLVGWMSPSLRRTVEALDRFGAVHAAGLAPFRHLLGNVAVERR